jgi:Tfp pilus assembly protein PilW
MVSTVISSIVLLGVITSVLMIGRVSANIQNYTNIELVGRKALETISREVRLAYNITAFSDSSVTLSVPDSSASRSALGYSVTYTFDSVNKQLTRTGPPADDPTGTSATTTIITGVEAIPSNAVFNYYRYVNSSTLGQGYVDGFATNTVATTAPASAIQQVEVKFLIRRKSVTVTDATNKVLSARFILRNK